MTAPNGSVAPRWTARDTLLVTILTASAGLLRLVGITWPPGYVFDEFYAADACLYIFGPHPPCPTSSEIGLYHPPLGMWLIGLGERFLGFTPAGWRVAPLIAGVLSIAVLYLLARRVTGSTMAAALAAGLLTLDPLHFVMSRTAMLDIFVVCFGLISYLCLLHDRDRGDDRTWGGWRAWRDRPWLVAAGAAGGAALACKWSGGYLLAGVLVLAAVNAGSRWRDQAALLIGTLVVLPGLIYLAAYAGRLDGTLLAWPWAHGSWTRAFLARQYHMVAHHTGALYSHPYASPAWSWPLIKRPVLFTINDLGTGYQEILALGNPLVWWPALVACAATVWRAWQRRRVSGDEVMIVVGVAAAYVPWLIITRQEAFLYYFLPALPFLYLAVAFVVAELQRELVRQIATGLLIAAAIGPFLYFRPVLVGSTLSLPQWERRILFHDCGPLAPGETFPRPVTRPLPAPHGWCWA